MPYANQGPLLGMFFTGPLGFCVGRAMGLLAKRFRWHPAVAALTLGLCCSFLGASIYASCEPDDRWIASLIDGTVMKCSPPIAFADEVLGQWKDSIAINPEKTVAKSWREDVRHTLASASGFVATFRIDRKRELYVGRKDSNYGATYASPWVPKRETVRYFVSADMCPTSDQTKRRVFLTNWPVWPDKERFPPDDAARLFSFSALQQVPSSYASWTLP
jgi:hypothetical protein